MGVPPQTEPLPPHFLTPPKQTDVKIYSQWVGGIGMSTRNFIGSSQNSTHPFLAYLDG